MRYTLIKDLLPMFESKLEKLTKKFEKYGDYKYIKFKPYICEDKDSIRYGYELIDIEVDASYKIDNYEFIASLEWIPEAEENLIKKASENIFVPEIFKTRRECDHCKSRRYRKSTIVLKNIETDEYIQIGKTCVKDYLGVDLGKYANYLSFFDDLTEYLLTCEKDNISRYRPHYSLREILKNTLEDTKQFGYISKALSIENDCDSTAYKICSMMFMVKDYTTGKLMYQKYETFSEDIEEQVDDVLNFFSEYKNEEKSDYIGNIKTILKLDWVEGNQIALVVSAVGTKLRIEAQREKELNVNKIASKHVGKIGEKIQFTATPICLYSSDSSYGYYYIYRMLVDNNEIIWKTTKKLNVDSSYVFTATIKSHESFKGVKQTEITRAKTQVLN